MLKKIDYWLRGYLRIKIRGNKLEELINLLVDQQIELWNVVRSENQLYLNIELDNLERVEKYLEEENCELFIIKRFGLPIIKSKIINRKFIAIGLIISIILIYLLSSFIFFIEIRGNDRLATNKLIEQLANLEVKRGVLKSSIPQEDLEEIIVQNNRQIAWANLYFEGTKLIVEIVEKKLIDSEVEPSDIIASKAGVITELIVMRGTPKVAEGDTVKQGDVLISKEVTNTENFSEDSSEDATENIKTEEVKAAGIVKAKVWYEGYGEATTEKSFKQSTAKEVESIILKYNNKEVAITGPNKKPYQYFKVEETVKSLPQWRSINLPLEIVTRKYIKQKKLHSKRTIERAKEIAKEKAIESILQQVPKEVIIMNSDLKLIKLKQEEKLFRVKAVVEVEEDITARREE
ncbi:MAG: sporulation protein YqfD [Bacillota bacterium]